MEIFHLLAGPLIGALIGYCTNYIAVKMLFRPFRPIRVFGHRLPFTPGVIPKGQGRLARAIGGVIGTTLLTEDDVRQTLLSDEVTGSLRSGIDRALAQKADVELGTLCLSLADETAYDASRRVMQDKLTDTLADRVSDMHLGETIASQVLDAVRQKVSGSLIGMMLSDDMLAGFAGPIRDGIDTYLQGNAYALLRPEVTRGWTDLEHRTVGEVQSLLAQANLSLTDVLMAVYEKLADSRSGALLRMLDLSGVAERRILAMQPEELERLVLSVLKKELRAVVNLGALVGFVLGLLNLIF